MGVSPMQAPDKPTYVSIHFEKGVPTAIDGREMGAVEIVETLNKIGGENGVGLADLVENRLVGMKSRGVYETPGGTILYEAHRLLETITLDKATMHYKQMIAIKFGEMVYDGQWFTPLREALSAFVTKTQETVTGDVKLRIYKGNVTSAGITSPQFPLQRGHRDLLGRRRRVLAEGRGGLHQPVRASPQGQGDAGCEETQVKHDQSIY